MAALPGACSLIPCWNTAQLDSAVLPVQGKKDVSRLSSHPWQLSDLFR